MKQLLKIYSIIALLVMLTVMLTIAVPWQNFLKKDITVIATFILNGSIWGILLFYELKKRAYSLLIIHWLFCFLFFFCIAFSQYMYGLFPWVAIIPDDTILKTNLYLFLWTVFVWFGYYLFTLRTKINTPTKSIRIPLWLILCLICFTIVNTIYRISTVGFSSLLARATAVVSYGMETSSTNLLVPHTLQALSFFATVFTLIFYKQKHQGLFLVGVTIFCLLISYFPTALSRNAAAAVYGGLLLIMFPSLRKNRIFILLLLTAFLIIFPFLNVFRGTNFQEADITNAIIKVFSHLEDGWLEGDYDAYAMLTLILEYTQHYGCTWGKQFLVIILFWIPRSIWLTKPIGTGAFVSSTLGWNFTNLSAPLPAEGFINFGWMGLSFAICLGWFMKKLDKKYWVKLKIRDRTIRPYDLLYPVLIMFFFFMNRGDLLSSFAYTMGYVVVWWILCKCCKKVQL